MTGDASHSLILLWLCCGCAAVSARAPEAHTYTVLPLVSGSTSNMRGVSVVDVRVVWASGTGGSVLRSVDGGATWLARGVPGGASLDFRDIEAFDSITAYVLSAGEDGRIYKTVDGGLTWQLQFQNQAKGAFFDCFDFWDARRGIAMSDPVGGRFLIVHSEDGTTWRAIEPANLPPAQPGEAAFAASGTCLTATADQRVHLATGGGAEGRVLVSADGGRSWWATATPVAAGAPSAGIFSLAFRDSNYGIAIGGDYTQPDVEAVVARTSDGGVTWTRAGRTSYVSGAAFVGSSDTVMAVGTNGTRLSSDGGMTWLTLDTLEYNAVQFTGDGTGYAVGSRGRIAKIVRR
jgi:photosystem II stability/assembly factor-like uncharacterized protein